MVLDAQEMGRVRVAIVSDTHCHLDERVAEIVKTCDYVVHAGDIGDAATLEALEPRQGKVLAVCGNNDIPGRWPERETHLVEELPRVAEFRLPGGRLVVEHGEHHGFHTPRHDSLRQTHPNARVIVYGHTHRLVWDHSEAPWVVNPGAAGRTRTNGGPSCLVLTAAVEGWDIEAHQFPEAVAA